MNLKTKSKQWNIGSGNKGRKNSFCRARPEMLRKQRVSWARNFCWMKLKVIRWTIFKLYRVLRQWIFKKKSSKIKTFCCLAVSKQYKDRNPHFLLRSGVVRFLFVSSHKRLGTNILHLVFNLPCSGKSKVNLQLFPQKEGKR